MLTAATALAAGLLAGLTAGFAAYVLLGPVLVIQSQLSYERVRAEAEDVNRLGQLVVARVQGVGGITRTLTCPVVHLG